MDKNIVGIRYVEAGPLHYCSAGDLRVGIGDYVIVTTDRGERLGWVVLTPEQVIAVSLDGPVRLLSRLASADEVEQHREQKRRAQEDVGRAQSAAARVDPRVRVASIEYDMAGRFSELTYTARENTGDVSDRIHREVVRVLAPESGPFDLRVEQVGDRDRAKAIGGVGQCGRGLCCSTWMTEFPAISIKMAKDQGLAPNPSKISGVCGRLLCCLSFEVDAYREIVGSLPKVGKKLTTPVGKAKVLSINALTEMVRLRFEDSGQIIEISTEAVKRQMGTTLRPDELDAEFEEALRDKDRRRTENLIAVIQPIERSLRETSSADGPVVDEAEREQRRLRRERPRREGTPDRARDNRAASGEPRRGRSGQRPARDGAPQGDRQPRGGRRDGQPSAERTGPPPQGTESRSGIRITRRRAGEPGTAPVPAEGTERRSRPATSRPQGERPMNPRPPRAQGDATASTPEDGEQKRRRRRGRRGGRRRGGGEGAGGEGGSAGPAPSID